MFNITGRHSSCISCTFIVKMRVKMAMLRHINQIQRSCSLKHMIKDKTFPPFGNRLKMEMLHMEMPMHWSSMSRTGWLEPVPRVVRTGSHVQCCQVAENESASTGFRNLYTSVWVITPLLQTPRWNHRKDIDQVWIEIYMYGSER